MFLSRRFIRGSQSSLPLQTLIARGDHPFRLLLRGSPGYQSLARFFLRDFPSMIEGQSDRPQEPFDSTGGSVLWELASLPQNSFAAR